MTHKDAGTTGLKTGVTILDKWGATGEQISAILGVSGSIVDRARSQDLCWQLSLDEGQLTRISLVLNMHAALRMLFDNPENLYGFMSLANHNAFFHGRTPLEVIAGGDLTALHETWRRLDALSHMA